MRLKTDPIREKKFHEVTGIYVRAIGSGGHVSAYDIAELDAESLTAWLKRDKGSNLLAENTVRVILGHPQESAQ